MMAKFASTTRTKNSLLGTPKGRTKINLLYLKKSQFLKCSKSNTYSQLFYIRQKNQSVFFPVG